MAYQFQVALYGLRCKPSMAGYALMFTAESNIRDVSNEATAKVTQDISCHMEKPGKSHFQLFEKNAKKHFTKLGKTKMQKFWYHNRAQGRHCL